MWLIHLGHFYSCMGSTCKQSSNFNYLYALCLLCTQWSISLHRIVDRSVLKQLKQYLSRSLFKKSLKYSATLKNNLLNGIVECESSRAVPGKAFRKIGFCCMSDAIAGISEVEQISAPNVCARWKTDSLTIQI